MNGPIYDDGDSQSPPEYNNIFLTNMRRVSTIITTKDLRSFARETLGVTPKGVSREAVINSIVNTPQGVSWFKHVYQLTQLAGHANVDETKIAASSTSARERSMWDTVKATPMYVTEKRGEQAPNVRAINLFPFINYKYSAAEVDALYRKLDKPVYGNRVIVADIVVKTRGGKKVRNNKTTLENVSIRTRSKEVEPTFKELVDAYYYHAHLYGLEWYDSPPMPEEITMITIHDEYKITNDMDWKSRAHFGTSLKYMDITEQPNEWTLEKNSRQMCGYDIISEDLGINQAEVSKLIGKEPSFGMTADDLVKVYKSKGKSLRVFDMNDKIIAKFIFGHDERKQTHLHIGESFTLLLANEHVYKPNDEARKRLLKHTPDKKFKATDEKTSKKEEGESKSTREKEPDIEEYATTFLEALRIAQQYRNARDPKVLKDKYLAQAEKLWADIQTRIAGRPLTKKKGQNMKSYAGDLMKQRNDILDKMRDVDTEVKWLPMVKIYLPKSDIGPDIKWLLLEYGEVYNHNMNELGVATSMSLGYKVNIFANDKLDDLQQTASELGINYMNQKLASMSRSAFKEFKSRHEYGWESSTMNAELRGLLEGHLCDALNLSHLAFLEEGSKVSAVDFYRQFASIARLGGFYTTSFMDEITKYDDHKIGEEPYLYWIDTTDGVLFEGNGIYDYQVVAYGLEMKIIDISAVKYQVKCQASEIIDKTLREYVDYIYKNVSIDNHRKNLVNMLIGSFAAISKHETLKSYTVDNYDETCYYFNTCGATHPMIKKIGNLSPDLGEPKPVYMVHSSDLTYYTKTNTLIRRRIVQHSRMTTHKLMTKISQDYKILAIKTDCVLYEVRVNQKDFPVSKKHDFGSTRREHVSVEVRNQTYWNPQEPSIHTTVFNDTKREWKTPCGKVSETEKFDFNRLLNLNRAFIEGAAGTGKSHILKALAKHFTDSGLRVAICAFTHAAAILIDGVTSHSLFDINGTDSVDIASSFDVILIDELSMNPGSIYHKLCTVPPHIKMFGFGDFRQHIPIEGDRVTKKRMKYEERKKYKDTQMFRSLFEHNMVELKKNFRADAEHAAACINYHDFAEQYGIQKAISFAIPEKIKQVVWDRDPLPNLNITFTNAKKWEINGKLIEREVDEKYTVDIEERIEVDYDRRDDCEYYIEHYDACKFAYLLANKDSYPEIFKNSSRKDGEDPYVLATKYFANSWFTPDGMGHKRVEYFRCTQGRGRLIPNKSQSLSYITRPLRHAVSSGRYIDLDMEKAHPNILIQLCAGLGLTGDKIPCLYAYVKDPTVMPKLMAELGYEKDPVKKMMLAVINGGHKDYDTMNADKSEWMRKFKAEIQMIDDLFLYKYPERWEEHKKFRREREKLKNKRVSIATDEGSFVNMFLLEAEAKMLDAIKRELKKRKLMGKKGDDFVCCADGGMLCKDPRVNDELLAALEALITRDTGFVMKLTFKAMNVLHLPGPLPFPKKTKEMLKYLEPRLWDKFPRLGPGMPVIADETAKDKKLYQNNHRYVVEWIGVEEKKEEVKLDLTAETSVLASQFAQLAVDKDEYIGKVVRLRSVMKELEPGQAPLIVSVKEHLFRRDFQPAYAITSHKAQGATFRELHGVHELHLMGSAGGYVSLTRTDDAAKVIIFNEKPKNQAWLDHLKLLDELDAKANAPVVEESIGEFENVELEDEDESNLYEISDEEHAAYLEAKFACA